MLIASGLYHSPHSLSCPQRFGKRDIKKDWSKNPSIWIWYLPIDCWHVWNDQIQCITEARNTCIVLLRRKRLKTVLEKAWKDKWWKNSAQETISFKDGQIWTTLGRPIMGRPYVKTYFESKLDHGKLDQEKMIRDEILIKIFHQICIQPSLKWFMLLSDDFGLFEKLT